MNSISLAISSISERGRNILLTIAAIGFGVTLPNIFHLFGIGRVFLPMFLPILILTLISNPPYIFIAAIITPVLSTALFGMPGFTTSYVMIVQLSLIGTVSGWLKTKNIRIWIAGSLAVIFERLLSFGAACIFTSIPINPDAILQSYPGVLMLVISAFMIEKLFNGKK
jgi:hypothetical protein